MINIFGANYEEIGSLNKNLVLHTLGKVKIRYGKKYIDLLDNNGNINVTIPKTIKSVKSREDIKSDGLYILDGIVYAYGNGTLFQLTQPEGEDLGFLSYLVLQDLTEELLSLIRSNLRLEFSSLEEALKYIDNGIVFVNGSIYNISDGSYTQISATLKTPLREINELGAPTENSGLLFLNGEWHYSEFISLENLDLLSRNIDDKIQSLSKETKNTENEIESFDPILYSEGYKIAELSVEAELPEESDGPIEVNLTTAYIQTNPSHSFNDGDVCIVSVQGIKSDKETDSTGVPFLNPNLTLRIYYDNDRVVTENSLEKITLTFQLIYNNNSFKFIDELKIGTIKLCSKLDYWNSTTEQYDEPEGGYAATGTDAQYILLDGKYYAFEGTFNGTFTNKVIYIKASADTSAKFRIDYENAEIALEENTGDTNPENIKIIPHTVLGDLENTNKYYKDFERFRTYDSNPNLRGLFSDLAVFLGAEFREPLKADEEVLPYHYPKYSIELNKALNLRYKIVDGTILNIDDEGAKEIVPTIDWIAKASGITWYAYVPEDKRIYFYDSTGTQIGDGIDTTDFIIDGMVETVKIVGTNLEIAFNTDAGKETIKVPLKDIFNPDNYYTKTEVNQLIADSSSSSGTEVDNKLTDYAKKSDLSALVPSGTIVMWSGTTIPDGWKICDGTNGTPNLVDRFIRGTNIEGAQKPAVLKTGGNDTVSLTVLNLPAHTHAVRYVARKFGSSDKYGSLLLNNDYKDFDGDSWQGDSDVHVVNTHDTGANEAFSILPSYYSLIYIMKT